MYFLEEIVSWFPTMQHRITNAHYIRAYDKNIASSPYKTDGEITFLKRSIDHVRAL